MSIREIYEYYSREDVQKALLEIAKNREVVGVSINGSFLKRPDSINYPQDILALLKKGAVEFHCSIERWLNPTAITDADHMRIGWDLIFDIDCELFEHGKIATSVFIWGLKEHGIKNISIKFTGGSGFHIGIPWESIPKSIDYKDSKLLYPDLARKIIVYLKDFVSERLEKAFLANYSPEELASQVKKPLGLIMTDTGINPYQIVDIDPILVSPRHLFRMPYSLNAKTGLVSLPIDPEYLDDFKKEQADPKLVKTEVKFLKNFDENEAELLILKAIDWHAKREKLGKKISKKVVLKKRVEKENFPPCIKKILNGLADGRKRSVFILINFLRSLKWEWDDIENLMKEWNSKNTPPLRETYLTSQIRWHKRQNKTVLPANCLTDGWYKDFGVCEPDNICKGGTNEIKIKNPVNYPFKKMKK